MIFLTIVFLQIQCTSAKLENVCDGNSEAFAKTIAIKALIGDSSNQCLNAGGVNAVRGNAGGIEDSLGYTIGGKIIGLTGEGLKLEINSSDEFSVPLGSSEYRSNKKYQAGFLYDVSITTQPQGNICFLENESGELNSNSVTNVNINCIPECTTCLIYVTQNVYPGNFGKASSYDPFCNSDPNYPGSGYFKAMLVDNQSRRASISPNLGDGQIDWVMKPNKAYNRDLTTVIGTTDANGFLQVMTETPSLSATDHWTGFDPNYVNWMTSQTHNCNNWTSNSAGNFAITGNGYTLSTISFLAFSASRNCSTSAKIVCVGQ